MSVGVCSRTSSHPPNALTPLRSCLDPRHASRTHNPDFWPASISLVSYIHTVRGLCAVHRPIAPDDLMHPWRVRRAANFRVCVLDNEECQQKFTPLAAQFNDPRLRQFNLVAVDRLDHGDTEGRITDDYDPLKTAEDLKRVMVGTIHRHALAVG